jgi:endonuclease YncB( thermonuclease family)
MEDHMNKDIAVVVGVVGVFLAGVCVGGASARCEPTRVIDGDTIRLGDTTHRLWGIDAPESKQDCEGQQLGLEAATHLRSLMGGHVIECIVREKDMYGRSVSQCNADGVDLSKAMVRDGMAYAFIRYSKDYVVDEATAHRLNLGVHKYHCELPWEWRKNKKAN